jgi:predicted GNAT superfamily acetyltransferase
MLGEIICSDDGATMTSGEAVREPTVTIRPVETVAEYRACQELQRQAWGIVEDGYIVPIATMISVQHAGGLVLGAFIDGDSGAAERLAGFAFAYLGRVRGRWALYSQLAAVDDSVRALGIGGRIKQAQRSWAREQGLALVAWTFDPMQAGNANFNLRRLGAFCRTYHAGYFGERSDALNAGLDSDRLLAEWPVAEAERRWHRPDDAPTTILSLEAAALRRGDAASLDSGAPVRIEIPARIDALKRDQPDLARLWQAELRSAFSAAFAAGHVAMDVERQGEGARQRVFYILRRPVDAESLIA